MALKIAVFTDVHGNLFALEAIAKALKSEAPDLIFFTGDCISGGPFPSECIDLLASLPNTHCIRGNHEDLLLGELPPRVYPKARREEEEHFRWIHSQISGEQRDWIRTWPHHLTHSCYRFQLDFIHYPRVLEQNRYRPVIVSPYAAELDELFEGMTGDIVFYGHHHPHSDITGRSRYINPGAAGAYDDCFARYTTLELRPRSIHVAHKRAAFDLPKLYRAFKERSVPDADTIFRVYYGPPLRDPSRESDAA